MEETALSPSQDYDDDDDGDSDDNDDGGVVVVGKNITIKSKE